jgi:uncharacterized membrane protein
MISLLWGDAQIEQLIWARPIPMAAMLAVFAGILALTAYLYRRAWGMTQGVRIGLAITRLLALALIVAALLEPTAVVKQTRTHKRRIPVLLDVSESMSVKDQRKRPEDIVEAAAALGMLPLSETTEVSRASMALDAKQRRAIAASSRLDLTRALLVKSARPIFESIGEALDVSYHAFAKTPHRIQDGNGGTMDFLAELKAVEPETSIADSLQAVANTDRGAPLAGIVLLSDGIDNTSSRRSEEMLHDLGIRGIPVYTIPIGLADPDDVSIRNIVIQEVAFSGDRVPVRVQIRSKGYEKRSARLVVLLNGRRVSQRMVRFEGGLQFEDISFRIDLYKKGAAHIDISIEPFSDEVSVENNRVERSIRVVNEKINVLYIEGSPRWEFRYLRAILKRDPRINATFIASNVGPEMARNSPEHIERFPDRAEEAFKYDLVILGDVDAAFFRREEIRLLEELVRDRGGSLLMLCGALYSPSSYADTPIESMLPVRFDPDSPWEEVEETVHPVLTSEGRSSMVMTLENDTEKNDRIWSRVAPLDRLPPFIAPKPGATVLAGLSDVRSRADRYPLVAWQRYGTGKCMAMGTDKLWRLRFKTGDKYHWRVWSQCIQFLTLSRLMGEHKRIRLETGRSVYPAGDQARFYAHVLDDSFTPVVQSRFDVVVTTLDDSGTEESVSLRPDTAHPGLYEGYFSPPAPGRYRMEANADDRNVSNTTEFQVTDLKLEMADTEMRIEHLRRIADLSGGACLGIQQLQSLQSLVNREPYTTTIRTERPVWDNGLVAFLLIVLTGLEWILRRRYDLP